jgi:subtilisin family serine protease
MTFTKRQATVGLVSAAVVVTMTGVSTWALAEEHGKPAAVSAKSVRLIVGYQDAAARAAAEAKIAATGARRTASGASEQTLAAINATTVEVSAASKAATVASLQSDPNVAYVEVDRVRKAYDLTPNDPEFAANQQEMRDVAAPAAWDTTTGTGVKIAVIDTGVNAVGDLAGAVTAGYDFVNNDSSAADDEGHGTAVASLIAARGNNDTGMAGVCWGCQIIPVKVLDYEGNGNDGDIASGIIWAVRRGAKVVNLSLGGPGTSKVLNDAVAYANMNGVLVVAAAGNRTGTVRQYPAALTDVVAVAATNRGSLGLSSWSARNASGDRWVDIAAPGTVTALSHTGGYLHNVQGTSFSAPIVSGIAGLIKSQRPNYTGWSLMNALQRSAAYKKVSGTNHGRVDARIALMVGSETVAPTSSGLSPGQGAYVRGTFAVKANNLKDNASGIRNVVLYADGVYKGYSRTAPFTVNYNSAGRNGPVKLQLRIYDKAGNLRILDRTVNADNVAPAVRITKAPKNKSRVSGTVKVSFTGSDRYGVRVYQLIVDGKVRQSRTSTASPFTFNGSAYGSSMTVQVRAYDRAGNAKLSTKYTYRH